MSPLADGVLNINFFQSLPAAKLIVVTANRLGVIHQTLATCAAAECLGVTPAGIILSQVSEQPDESTKRNAAEIANYTDVPVLGEIGFGSEALPFDWA